MSFLMIPLKYLYEEYIDRPKCSEQKKPFEYTVPSPTIGVETNKLQKMRSKLMQKDLQRQILTVVFLKLCTVRPILG